ncbi:hypothetical protein D3C83_117940 [compost metagenome]
MMMNAAPNSPPVHIHHGARANDADGGSGDRMTRATAASARRPIRNCVDAAQTGAPSRKRSRELIAACMATPAPATTADSR